jgi:hypothetical protein
MGDISDRSILRAAITANVDVLIVPHLKPMLSTLGENTFNFNGRS